MTWQINTGSMQRPVVIIGFGGMDKEIQAILKVDVTGACIHVEVQKVEIGKQAGQFGTYAFGNDMVGNTAEGLETDDVSNA